MRIKNARRSSFRTHGGVFAVHPIYAKNDIPQQQTTIGYGADGRVASAGFTHQGEQKVFTYTYLPGTHLLHTLAHPNGLTLTQSYDATRDLPTQMSYSRADALVVQRSYDYDLLGRPTARNLARYGTQTSDTFGYNTRSESPRGLGGGLDNARSGIAPKGRAGNGVPASQPTQETATRPLAIQKNGTWYTYGWDLTKNICETYRTDGRIDLAHTYTPYGEVSPAHAYDQPLRWSSEYHDVELGLHYYNYRHYNPAMGRWMSRDVLFYNNLYKLINNNNILITDFLGLWYPTKESEGQPRRVYVKEHGDSNTDLAKQIGLDVSEFDKWAIPLSYNKKTTNNDSCIAYSVPNTWIIAQLLPSDGIIQIGGIIGGFGHKIRLLQHNIVEVNDIKSLFSSFNNDTIGFVIYAHGFDEQEDTTAGTIIAEEKVNGQIIHIELNQGVLQQIIKDKVNYKLRDARLLQCFSMKDDSTRNAWFDIANSVYGFKYVNAGGFSDRTGIINASLKWIHSLL